jgi:hypothetical protein
MAAIDKIYGTKQQHLALIKYLTKAKPEYLKYIYSWLDSEVEGPISNFSAEADEFLYINCPLQFVIDALEEQYGSAILSTWKKKHAEIEEIFND